MTGQESLRNVISMGIKEAVVRRRHAASGFGVRAQAHRRHRQRVRRYFLKDKETPRIATKR